MRITFDEEHASDAERKHLARYLDLEERGLAERTDGGGFRLHLTVPIPAFPDKPDVDSKIDSLKFRASTIGDQIDNEGDGLALIESLTGLSEQQLRSLNPKDYQHAEVVAYLPLLGPAFLPVGKAG